MTQCSYIGRARAWGMALVIVLGAGGVASCGGSSEHTNSAGASTIASSSSPSSGSGGTTAPSTTPGVTTPKSSKPNTQDAAPAVRASSFVSCMRAHGVNLPAPTKSSGGATLDFKGVDTKSAKYKSASAACAPKLLGNLPAGKKGGIRLKGIKVRGIHLKSIHIGHIELKNIHIPAPTVTVPPVHVTTPGPNLGGQSGGQ